MGERLAADKAAKREETGVMGKGAKISALVLTSIMGVPFMAIADENPISLLCTGQHSTSFPAGPPLTVDETRTVIVQKKTGEWEYSSTHGTSGEIFSKTLSYDYPKIDGHATREEQVLVEQFRINVYMSFYSGNPKMYQTRWISIDRVSGAMSDHLTSIDKTGQPQTITFDGTCRRQAAQF